MRTVRRRVDQFSAHEGYRYVLVVWREVDPEAALGAEHSPRWSLRVVDEALAFDALGAPSWRERRSWTLWSYDGLFWRCPEFPPAELFVEAMREEVGQAVAELGGDQESFPDALSR